VIDGKRRARGSPAQRFIDAELVFRDPKHVDQGRALYKEALWRAHGLDAQLFETVPFQRVRSANYRLLCNWLTHKYGRPFVEDGMLTPYKQWPCPNCEGKEIEGKYGEGHVRMPAEVDSRTTKLAECWKCSATEDTLLKMIRAEKGNQ
jgi:hypothetical protein